jgi:hypothetical protein
MGMHKIYNGCTARDLKVLFESGKTGSLRATLAKRSVRRKISAKEVSARADRRIGPLSGCRRCNEQAEGGDGGVASRTL